MAICNPHVATFGRLGHLDDPSPQAKRKWIYGAWIANARLLRELLHQGLAKTLDFYGPTGRIYSMEVSGCKCRELPFTDFPREAPAQGYELLYCTFGWNSGLPSLRAQYLPRASLVQSVHSTHYERTLWDFGCQLCWDLFEPYDAIVCSSATSVRTLRNMIAYWEERSAALRGAKIPFPGVIAEIPLGTDVPLDPPQRAIARQKLGWHPEQCNILVVARFSSFDKMDHAVLLPVLKNVLAKSDRPVSLVLAGEDTQGEAERLIRLAGRAGLDRHLRVYANVDFDTRGLLYAASDVFLSPADHVQETFGLTILEAMSYGLPVIASDWGGYRDLIDHGRTGFLVPTVWGGRLEDLGSMASFDAMTATYATARRTAVDLGQMEEFLLELISNQDLAQAMGNAGRKHVRQNYTWLTVARKFGDLWSELADRRARARTQSRTLPPPRGHNYPTLFGHYPTHRVSRQDRVAVRAASHEDVQANPVFVLSFEEEQRAIKAILSALDGGSQIVEHCLVRASEMLSMPCEKVEDHLLLAAKYGLIEIRPNT